MRDLINEVFVRYVGPIAHDLAAETWSAWLQDGNTGPSAIHDYIALLSRHIAEDGHKASFGNDARAAMRAALSRLPR